MNFGKIALIAPLRNVGKFLAPQTLQLREALSKIFSQVHMIFVESDSSDDTVSAAFALLEQGLITDFISLGELSNQHPQRCDRIAIARNMALELAFEKYDFDYLACADMDGVNEGITADGIASCFKYRGWVGMIANQYGRYYDVWPLRHHTWCPSDSWDDFKKIRPQFGTELSKWMVVGSRQIHIPPETKPIHVSSGFGGFGLYAAAAAKNARWLGLDQQGAEVCEWLSFCSQLKDSIFINPMMRNVGAPEHLVQPPSGGVWFG